MQLNNQLADQVTTSPAYLAAIAHWRSCMAGRGLLYTSPEAAHRELSMRVAAGGPTPEIRSEEIAVASADGECAAATHLPSAALLVRRELALSLPPEQRELIIALVADRDQALKRAEAVLSE